MISGRPWDFVVIVHGFMDKIAVLQFEWAFQYLNKSRHVKRAFSNNDDNKKKLGLLYRR